MPARATIFACILLTTLALLPRPAHAQIAFYTDSSGQKIFINANPAPTPRSHSAARAYHTSPAPATPAATTTSVAGDADASTSAPSDASNPTPENASASGDSAPGATAPSAAAPGEVASQQPESPASAHLSLDQMVHQVSAKYNVDPELVRAVVGAESNWDPHAVSRVGAQGLMQLEPTTARLLGVRDSFDPQQNLDGGVRYLRSLLVRYGGDLDRALAAYNAGPGAVDRAGGVPHFAETRSYVQRVTGNYYRPGSDRSSYGALAPSHPIYRATDDAGRTVFTNE